MKHAANFIVLLVFAVLALAGCKPADPVCASRISHVGTFTNTCGLGVPQDAKSAELHLQADLQQGSMTWELEDPSGQIVRSGYADMETPADQSINLDDPLPGRWTLHIHLEEAQGEYAAPWIVK